MNTHPAARIDPEAASRLLLTKKQLSAMLPMPVRTIEKFVGQGIIPCLRLTPRMVRFQLSKVLVALEKYETATMK